MGNVSGQKNLKRYFINVGMLEKEEGHFQQFSACQYEMIAFWRKWVWKARVWVTSCDIGSKCSGIGLNWSGIRSKCSGIGQNVVALDQNVAVLDQNVVALDQNVAVLDQNVVALDQV